MEKYIQPEIEVIRFEVEDVITASSVDTGEDKNAGSVDGEWVKIGC